MLSSALLSLGVAGSALAWPSHSRHASIARAVHAREEVAPATSKAPVAATWYASWHAQDFPLANVSWSKYTTVTYSFAVTTPNVSFVNITDPDVFQEFVETAHANNCSASISVGGWTGSQYFSTAVATAENRTEFVKTMVNLVKDNNLDGLDFDWEYPGRSGIGCNTLSANDTDNFLAFLTELRTALPNTTLSAATSITPFMSADLTTPSTNVSGFANVLDYIAIMNYDIWGSWSDTVGPNAPLNDTCAADATQKVGSAVSAVEAWTKAGIPVDQLVLGVASYGHGFSVAQADALTGDNTLQPYAKFNKSYTPPGDAWDDAPAPGAVDVCGNPQAQGGNWNFWGLVVGGFLNENGTANTAEGIEYKFDECSQTPFVYNKTSQVMVAFDNAASFAAKGQFINSTGLRGFAMWEAGGDFDDILLDSIRSAVGFSTVDDDDEECEDPTSSYTSAAPEATTAPAATTAPSTPETTEAAYPPSGESKTTKSSSGGAKTSKAPSVAVAAASPTSSKAAAPATTAHSTTASDPAPTADPTADPEDDEEECEDDEDPETTSVAASTAVPASTHHASSTAHAASPVSSATSTSSAASAEPTDDEECEDEYDE